MFYPAAALYGMFVLPASVLAMTGRLGGLHALSDPMGHAHEMLFGFGLAVVAGNQLGPARGPRVGVLFSFWVAARIAFLVAPASILSVLLNATFAALLGAQVAPRLFGAAKKLRNLALPAVLTALCAAAIAWQIARYAGADGFAHAMLQAALMLFALLMLFMGGRIIAPAVAGQLYRQGEQLDARVQPRIETALIIACGIALGALVVPRAQPLAAATAAAAGVLAAIRLARWRLWSVRARPDLLCLASGYGWLALGLLAFGASLAAGRHQSIAIHLITVGGLGTLTLNVMAMSRLLRARRAPGESAAGVWGTALIAAAATCRVLGAFYPEPWLMLAALCWAAAFAILIALFWRIGLRT